MKKVLNMVAVPRMVTVPLAIIALMFSFSEANASSYKPAKFNFAEDALNEKMSEDLSERAMVLYCQTDVDATGAPNVSRCFNKAGANDVAKRLEMALGLLRLSPAEVDGQTVPVRVSYRVVLVAGGVQVIPNLGTMQEKYGRDYIAPQERLDVSDWYQKYANDSWVNGEAFLGEGDLSRIAATVNDEGRPEVVRTIEAQRAHKRDATIVKNALRRSRFIPGFVAGKPVAMGYLAVVNYPRRKEAIGTR